ncbi:tol-pal system protein YbgF [Pseudomonas jilinensis]|uniref:Cell division coordinator CpoB n=1 Tax=Pseudomonas jilinensis TaxID=2078689 RepID=A0A396S2G7_9PSED|nr:tol-pal system protein YbgF [Pseudomonas jilinensis]RHW21862.1 tol-pal system protein YbgF [Pseudomonas jilinensis]
MKGYRGVVLGALLLPLVAQAQVPVVDGSGTRAGTGQTPPSVTSPATAGLSMEGQLMQQMYQLQQEVSMLRGLLEEQEYRIRQMEQDQLERYQDLDRRLSGQGSAGNGASAPLPAANEPVAGGALTPVPTAESNGAAAESDPEREKLLYDAAFDLVKARDFDKAIMAFNAFLRRYPNSDYAGNAQYWLGELHLAQSDLEESGRAFAQVISRYSGHRKEADALYKLADVERRLGNSDKARQLYQEVLSKHPNSSAAQLARRDMATL